MRLFSLLTSLAISGTLLLGALSGTNVPPTGDASDARPAMDATVSSPIAPGAEFPASGNGTVRGMVQIFGQEEGAAIITRTDGWQVVTKTLFTRLESLSHLPVLPNTTREYYLGVRHADKLAECAPDQSSYWRFFYPWVGWAGHEFTVHRSWSNLKEGNMRWIQVPGTEDQRAAAGASTSNHAWHYWRLEARVPQACKAEGRAELAVMGLYVMIVDRENGTTPTPQINTDTGGGTRNTVYRLGAPGGRLNVHENGNVGIQTQTFGDALSVGGTIRSQKVVVTDQGWADYVFDDDYALRSPAALRTFIDANGHLPGVPSAADVQRNGLDLGDAQRALLEKVEELTLYTLDQHDRIEQQRGEIESLREALHRQQAQIDRLLNAEKSR